MLCQDLGWAQKYLPAIFRESAREATSYPSPPFSEVGESIIRVFFGAT